MKNFLSVLACLAIPYSASTMEEKNQRPIVTAPGLGTLACYYQGSSYYVIHEGKVARVLPHDVDECVLAIKPDRLLQILSGGCYLYISQLSNGDYRIQLKVRGLGGWPTWNRAIKENYNSTSSRTWAWLDLGVQFGGLGIFLATGGTVSLPLIGLAFVTRTMYIAKLVKPTINVDPVINEDGKIVNWRNLTDEELVNAFQVLRNGRFVEDYHFIPEEDWHDFIGWLMNQRERLQQPQDDLMLLDFNNRN